MSGTKQRHSSACLGSLNGAFLWFPHTMPAAPSVVLALKSRTGRQTRKGPWEGSRGLDGRLHTFVSLVHRFSPSTGACEKHRSYKLLSVPFPDFQEIRLDFLSPGTENWLAVWMHRRHGRGRCLTHSSLRIQAHNITNNYTGLFAFPMPHINVRSNDLQLRLISWQLYYHWLAELQEKLWQWRSSANCRTYFSN